MSAIDRSAERKRFAIWSAIAVSAVIAAEFVGADPSKLVDRDGLSNAGDLLSGLANPDFSKEFLLRIGALSVESLMIGVLGTVLAVILGGAIALFTVRVPDLPHPPRQLPPGQRLGFEGVRLLGRWLLGILRSIPEIVWAYLFVRLFGLGAIPAILAIGLAVGGSIGKLYSELAEAVDPRAVLALRTMGARRFPILFFSVIPQVSRQWVAYALFRLECNIRSGTILGVVGAGGLGSEIALAIRYFQYDKLATALMAVLAFVIALEFVSAWLRRSPHHYAVIAAVAGGLLALIWLDLPLGDLLNPATEMAVMHLSFEWDFMATAARQVVDTLAMAWVATVVSAVVAFLLAPLAASPLTTRSYLPDPIRMRGLGLAIRTGAKWFSRAILQSTRAMPELTLALVFVVWVGAGPLAGILAIAVHNAGVLGRLYSDVLEEVEPGPPAALQAMGAGSMGTFLFGVLPQVRARLAAFTLYRFEVNVRATAMVGFVGAGGIGDSLHTAISLFHLQDLVVLLITMVALVTVVDAIGDRIRSRILRSDHGRTQHDLQPARVVDIEKVDAPSVFLPVTFGEQLVQIRRVLEVTPETIIVQTSQQVPEGQCMNLVPSSVSSSAAGVMVTACRTQILLDGTFVYELTPCANPSEAAQWVRGEQVTSWHLQPQPAAQFQQLQPN